MTDIASIVDAFRNRAQGSRYFYVGTAVVLFVMAVLPLILGSDQTSRISYGIGLMVFISLAISFNLIAGYAGQFSLGHILFYGVGGYAAMIGVTNFGMHWLLAIVFAALVGVVLAAVVGAITLRLRNIYFATGTLAVAEFTRIAMNNWDYVNGSSGIIIAPDTVNYSVFKWYYVVLAITILSFGLAVVFERTVFGNRLEAIRDNEAKAQAVGINTWYAKNVAFVTSAIPAAAIGAAHVLFLLSITPSAAFEPMKSIQMQLMVILGGLGTLLGPVVGGAMFFAVRELSVQFHPRLHHLITGPVVVLIILFAPMGIVGWLRGRR